VTATGPRRRVARADRPRRRAAFTAGAAIAAAGLASPALACSVCFVGREQTLAAFYGTAVLLSLLPLALFGSLGFWLHRRIKAAARQGAGATQRS
jgi:hypothetical protein